jgi:hypothetical protein
MELFEVWLENDEGSSDEKNYERWEFLMLWFKRYKCNVYYLI